MSNQPEDEKEVVSKDILNVLQSGQVKATSTTNKLSLLMYPNERVC